MLATKSSLPLLLCALLFPAAPRSSFSSLPLFLLRLFFFSFLFLALYHLASILVLFSLVLAKLLEVINTNTSSKESSTFHTSVAYAPVLLAKRGDVQKYHVHVRMFVYVIDLRFSRRPACASAAACCVSGREFITVQAQ